MAIPMTEIETSSKDPVTKLSKREAILESAGVLLLSNGFESTSMDQIAINANVSKQTIYSHFGNKAALFTAVVENKCQKHDLTQSLFDPERPVHEVLMDLARHFTDLIHTEEAICLHRLCISGGEKHSHIAQLFWQAGPVWLQNQFAQYLEKKKTDQQFHARCTTNAAQQFIYMLRGEDHLKLLLGLDEPIKSDELDQYILDCVELFERAYLKP